jgi:hypothetical protein
MVNVALKNLQKRNDALKSILLHEQLKCGSYSFKNFKVQSSRIIGEYKYHKSIFKAASNIGINHKTAIKWFIQGQLGNPQFSDFYKAISRLNNEVSPESQDVAEKAVPQIEGEYVISQYGDGWSYTTYVGGEKIFIISDDLDGLKRKVADRNLPLD